MAKEAWHSKLQLPILSNPGFKESDLGIVMDHTKLRRFGNVLLRTVLPRFPRSKLSLLSVHQSSQQIRTTGFSRAWVLARQVFAVIEVPMHCVENILINLSVFHCSRILTPNKSPGQVDG